MKIIVESAIALETKHKDNLERKFQEAFGGEQEIEFVVDPGIIGGLRISTPTKVLDLSLAARLNELNRSLVTKVK